MLFKVQQILHVVAIPTIPQIDIRTTLEYLYMSPYFQKYTSHFLKILWPNIILLVTYNNVV